MPARDARPDRSDFAAVLGIDWADQHHDISMLDCSTGEMERTRLPHTPEALGDFLGALEQRFGGRPVAVAVEQKRGPLINVLLNYAFLVLYPIQTTTLKRFREAFTPSGAKDDPTDAEMLLDLLLHHEDRLRAWHPDDADTRTLARLTQDRRKAVELRTSLLQQLKATLKDYFPQAIQWAGNSLAGPMALDFLERWPTLAKLQRARARTVRRFYTDHNCRHHEIIEARLADMKSARPLTTDPAVVEPAVRRVQLLVEQLRALGPSIAAYEQEIEERFAAHDDHALFDGLPGAGAALAPRLLTAFGTERDRYDSAEDLQRYTGIAPVTQRSGKHCQVRWRWNAPTFLRQTFHEFADHSIGFSTWARAYYELQRERGKRHHAAVRSLAFKWIRVLYRCWVERTPYDEARYLQVLRERGSPVAQRLSLAAA